MRKAMQMTFLFIYFIFWELFLPWILCNNCPLAFLLLLTGSSLLSFKHTVLWNWLSALLLPFKSILVPRLPWWFKRHLSEFRPLSPVLHHKGHKLARSALNSSSSPQTCPSPLLVKHWDHQVTATWLILCAPSPSFPQDTQSWNPRFSTGKMRPASVPSLDPCHCCFGWWPNPTPSLKNANLNTLFSCLSPYGIHPNSSLCPVGFWWSSSWPPP